MFYYLRFFLVPIILSLTATTSFSQEKKVELLDEYIQKAQKDWKVPGLAITVVKDGKILHSKGYGIRELGKKERVDAKTLFGAMSTTKAMVAVGMALLVDEGKISWNDKVIKHLPEFKIADEYITKELTIRDLLTHNSGLGNADFLWSWTPNLPSGEIVKRMQFAEPTYSFRGGYTYQNIMYLVAGKVIEKITGQSWEAYTEEKVFKPLGMTNSFANLERSKAYLNRSKAHFEINGKIEIIEESLADPIAPAGAVWSNAEDIGKWIQFLLTNKSKLNEQILKPATLAEIFKPQIIIPPNQFYPTVAVTKPHWTTYGLGWFQHDYRGEMVNFHTGSLAGRTAIIGLLRDHNLGVYVFGNLDHAEVRHALMYKVFDVFAFDDESRDWNAEMLELYGDLQAKGAQRAVNSKKKRIKNTQPSHPLSNYVGIYSDEFYGKVEITLKENQLYLSLSKTTQAILNHWHFDTFEAGWKKAWWGESLVSFSLDVLSGDVNRLTLGEAKFKKE